MKVTALPELCKLSRTSKIECETLVFADNVLQSNVEQKLNIFLRTAIPNLGLLVKALKLFDLRVEFGTPRKSRGTSSEVTRMELKRFAGYHTFQTIV